MSETPIIGFNWHSAINETYRELSQQVVSSAPKIIGAVVLLIFGIIVAHVLRIVVQKLVQGLDSLFKRVPKDDGVKQEQVTKSYARIIGKVTFWSVLTFFVASSANLLEWRMFAGMMDSLVRLLPSIVSGLLIVFGGVLIGNAARSGVMKATSTVSHGHLLSRTTQVVIVFTSVVIGVEQVGFSVHFLTSVIVVVVGIVLAGAVLAFSLGSKVMVSNLIGAQCFRKHCHIGETVKIGEYEGDIIEVTQTSIILETDGGRVVIPAKYFQEQVSELNSEDNLTHGELSESK